MKITTLFLGLIATSNANIVFNHAPLACNITSPKIYHGCFRGQTCDEDIGCVPDAIITYPMSFRHRSVQLEQRQAPFSIDGTCGPDHGGTICDPNSTAYTGGCCSSHGYCGNTDAHCGAGCVSGCTPTPAGTITPRPDGLCGSVSSPR